MKNVKRNKISELYVQRILSYRDLVTIFLFPDFINTFTLEKKSIIDSFFKSRLFFVKLNSLYVFFILFSRQIVCHISCIHAFKSKCRTKIVKHALKVFEEKEK